MAASSAVQQLYPDGCSVLRAMGFLMGLTPEQEAHCFTHDLAYAGGGTYGQRFRADLDLCIGWLDEGMHPRTAESGLDALRRYALPHWGPEGRYIDEPFVETEEAP